MLKQCYLALFKVIKVLFNSDQQNLYKLSKTEMINLTDNIRILTFIHPFLFYLINPPPHPLPRLEITVFIF